MSADPAQSDDSATSRFRLGGRRPRVMAQSAALDEEGSPRLLRRAAATITVAMLALIAWAAFLNVDDAVAIPGTVVPGGEVKVVRLADGGTVAEVSVKKGEIVEEGQILLRLKSGDLREEMEKVKIRRAGVGLLAAGLKALASGKPPDYSFAEPDHRELVNKERVVFESIKEITDRQRRNIAGEVHKLKTEIEEITRRQAALSKQTDVLEEELQFREELFKKGLTDKGVYAETKAQVGEAYNDLAGLTAERQQKVKQLADAEKRLSAFDVRLRGRVVSELLIVNPALEGLSESYRQLNDRVSRLTVSAPAGGVVRAAKIPAVGATLAPDTTILEVVPLAGETAIEALVPATDLARVKVGQPVTVTTTAGGSAGFAGISGTLTEISEAPTTDGQGRVVHKAMITIAGDPLKPAPERQRLTPGTRVEAAVKFGSRPLYAHLWRKIAGD